MLCLLEGALYETERLSGGAHDAGVSDAQLLAKAFERDGFRLFEDVRGEFWALLWDRQRREGVLLADQMGSRAPYWTRQDGDLVVASEVRELLACLTRRPEPDPMALGHWLMLSAPPRGCTLFAGVRRLEAGHLAVLDGRLREPQRYWSPSFQAPLRDSREELVDRVRKALLASVRRRVADASNVGVLLSGGLDSSTVAALSANVVEEPPAAYSATFPNHPTVDESALIEATAERLGLPSTRVVVRSGSVLTGALEYIASWQQPPTSPNLFFWTPLLERAAADGIDVMLDGEGGDELFGLSPYLLADRLRRGRVLSAVALARGWPPPFHAESARRVWIRLRRFGLKGALPWTVHAVSRRVRSRDHYAPSWLRPQVARAWVDSVESAFAWKQLDGPRWWASLLSGVTRGLGPALVYEGSRRRSALAGIQARHPLVDVDVIELVLRIPPETAFDSRFSRPLLRDAVNGLLPEDVRLRKTKSNFDAIFHAALAGPDLPTVRMLLEDPDAALADYVCLEQVNSLWLAAEPPTDSRLRQAWALQVWRLLTAECWLRGQRDPTFLQRLLESQPRHETAFEITRR